MTGAGYGKSFSKMDDDDGNFVITGNSKVFTGAEFLCEALAQAGVTHVFGGHGGAVVPLIDAIVAHPALTWVYMRCETNASQSAMAYAKLHRRLGCCIATSGPGASHLLSGLVDADQDRVPVLCITGMKDLGHTRHADFQDIDQGAIFRMASLALSETVSSIDQLLSLTRNAFSAAIASNRCAHLAVPIDIQMDDIEARTDFSLGTALQSRSCIPASRLQVEYLARSLRCEIEAGHRILVACGYRAAGMGELIERFAELLHAPILTSYDAKGVVDEGHPLAYGVAGVYGNAGTGAATDLLDKCQTVIGFCVGEWAELICDKSGLQVRRFVQIDESLVAGDSMRFDPSATFTAGFLHESLYRVVDLLETDLLRGKAEYSRRVTISSGTLGPRLGNKASASIMKRTYHPQNTKTIWEELKKGSFAKPTGTPSTYLYGKQKSTDPEFFDKEHCHPAVFMKVMSEYLDENSVICADIGDNALFMASSLIAKRGQRFLTSEHLGIMGFSINSGLAAAVSSLGETNNINGDGKVPVKKLVVAGDGGVQMSINELATLRDHGASNVLVVIIVNGRLGRVQNETWGPGLNADGCSIGAPDFVQLFKAYGYPGGMELSSSDYGVIEDTIEKGWETAEKNGACVIVIRQDPETHPIMHKLKFRESLHHQPYTRTRATDSLLPKIKVDHYFGEEKATVQEWLDSLTEVKTSDPYWLDKGDLLLKSPSIVVERLLPSLGGPAPKMFATHEDSKNFDLAFEAAVLNAIPGKCILDEVVPKGQSNSHPLKLQLMAIPPNQQEKLWTHPSIKLGLLLSGEVSERYLSGCHLCHDILKRDSPLPETLEEGKFYDAPSDEELAEVQKSLTTRIEDKIMSIGSHGHFLDRHTDAGQVMYYQIGSINQRYTKDKGGLIFVLWSGVHAELDDGMVLEVQGHEMVELR